MKEPYKSCWECKFCLTLQEHLDICVPFKQAILEGPTLKALSIKGNLSGIPPISSIDEMWLSQEEMKQLKEKNRAKLKR